jgi:hypothetical protein
VCHDLPNEHSMALMRNSHSLQLSFFFFTTPSQRCATWVSSNGKFAALKVGLFSLFRLSDVRLNWQVASRTTARMPAADRQSGFHHSFFVFFPRPGRLCGFGRSSPIGIDPPCFICCFRVSASTLVTLLLCLSVALNYHIYPRFIC